MDPQGQPQVPPAAVAAAGAVAAAPVVQPPLSNWNVGDPVTNFRDWYTSMLDVMNGTYQPLLAGFSVSAATSEEVYQSTKTNFPWWQIPGVFLCQNSNGTLLSINHFFGIEQVFGQPQNAWAN